MDTEDDIEYEELTDTTEELTDASEDYDLEGFSEEIRELEKIMITVTEKTEAFKKFNEDTFPIMSIYDEANDLVKGIIYKTD